MKVAHLTTGHPAFDTRVFYKQCTSLAAEGYDVYLVAPHNEDVFAEGVHIKAINTPKSRFNRMIISAWHIYKAALIIDANIYHLHDPSLIPIGLALKLKNKYVIFDSHEDFPADIMSKEWIPVGIRKYISIAYSNIEKYALPKFDAVVTVHEQIYSRIVKFQSNTFIVKNFPVIDTSFQVVEQRLPKFVWLGLMCPVRGCSQIDVAMKIQNNIALDVIGTVLNFKPSSDNITLLGFFSHQKAMRIASKYLAGVITYLPEPNHVDALPNKLFEYMALGLPVIASNFPKWREIVEDAGCGILVNPNSPQEIAKAMQWMFDNQIEAFKMGMRGRDAVIQKYSWLTEEKTLFKMYKGLIK